MQQRMQQRQLGSAALTVSALGLGCTGMSAFHSVGDGVVPATELGTEAGLRTVDR